MFLNIEIKAACLQPDIIRTYLLQKGANFKGIDFQTDTYFNTSSGRLKLREGNIENNLIYYQRENTAGAKSSSFDLLKVEDAPLLKQMLQKAIGIKVMVKKKREIYYIENVKFHIDEVEGLGSFIEIEAGNVLAKKTKEELQQQCDFYIKEFGIRPEDFIAVSYSDMLLSIAK